MQITEELLQQCRKQNVKAQRVLYDHFKSIVMGICRRYSRHTEEAEDIFQETFIRIFQNIGQLKSVELVEHWVRKIAVNAAVNYYHKHKKHHHEDYLDPENQNDDYELILSGLSDEILIDIINQLPDGYRMVFNLYVVEGFSHGEIATFLKISEATSRSQFNRARQVLKQKLKRLGILKYERYA